MFASDFEYINMIFNVHSDDSIHIMRNSIPLKCINLYCVARLFFHSL